MQRLFLTAFRSYLWSFVAARRVRRNFRLELACPRCAARRARPRRATDAIAMHAFLALSASFGAGGDPPEAELAHNSAPPQQADARLNSSDEEGGEGNARSRSSSPVRARARVTFYSPPPRRRPVTTPPSPWSPEPADADFEEAAADAAVKFAGCEWYQARVARQSLQVADADGEVADDDGGASTPPARSRSPSTPAERPQANAADAHLPQMPLHPKSGWPWGPTVAPNATPMQPAYPPVSHATPKPPPPPPPKAAPPQQFDAMNFDPWGTDWGDPSVQDAWGGGADPNAAGSQPQPKGWHKWQGPRPEQRSGVGQEKYFYKKQEWRAGVNGGDARYGTPGGKEKEYYRAFGKARGLGEAVLRAFKEEFGHPKEGTFTAERKQRLLESKWLRR